MMGQCSERVRTVVRANWPDRHSSLDTDEYKECLDNIQKIILATDLAQHLRIIPQQKEMAEKGYDFHNPDHRYLLSCLIVTSCDLCVNVKMFEESSVIVRDHIYTEFFSEGDMEKQLGRTPMQQNDRKKACIPSLQIRFNDFILAPLYRLLHQIFPAAALVMEQLDENRVIWESISLKHSQEDNHNCVKFNTYTSCKQSQLDIERKLANYASKLTSKSLKKANKEGGNDLEQKVEDWNNGLIGNCNNTREHFMLISAYNEALLESAASADITELLTTSPRSFSLHGSRKHSSDEQIKRKTSDDTVGKRRLQLSRSSPPSSSNSSPEGLRCRSTPTTPIISSPREEDEKCLCPKNTTTHNATSYSKYADSIGSPEVVYRKIRSTQISDTSPTESFSSLEQLGEQQAAAASASYYLHEISRLFDQKAGEISDCNCKLSEHWPDPILASPGARENCGQSIGLTDCKLHLQVLQLRNRICDMEKQLGRTPMQQNDRKKACIPSLQIRFNDFILAPLYRLLHQIFPAAALVMEQLDENRVIWESISLKHSQEDNHNCVKFNTYTSCKQSQLDIERKLANYASKLTSKSLKKANKEGGNDLEQKVEDWNNGLIGNCNNTREHFMLISAYNEALLESAASADITELLTTSPRSFSLHGSRKHSSDEQIQRKTSDDTVGKRRLQLSRSSPPSSSNSSPEGLRCRSTPTTPIISSPREEDEKCLCPKNTTTHNATSYSKYADSIGSPEVVYRKIRSTQISDTSPTESLSSLEQLGEQQAAAASASYYLHEISRLFDQKAGEISDCNCKLSEHWPDPILASPGARENCGQSIGLTDCKLHLQVLQLRNRICKYD
eukprot:sb/3462058/